PDVEHTQPRHREVAVCGALPGAAPGQIADRRATATAEEAQARKRHRWRIHGQHGRLASFKMACMSDLWQA
ncbi:hypothetical protein HaLaN_27763, partial [Haematococcus lacustris]